MTAFPFILYLRKVNRNPHFFYSLPVFLLTLSNIRPDHTIISIIKQWISLVPMASFSKKIYRTPIIRIRPPVSRIFRQRAMDIRRTLGMVILSTKTSRNEAPGSSSGNVNAGINIYVPWTEWGHFCPQCFVHKYQLLVTSVTSEWWHLGQMWTPATKEKVVTEISSLPWDKLLFLSLPLILYQDSEAELPCFNLHSHLTYMLYKSYVYSWELAFFFFNGRRYWKTSSSTPSLFCRWDFKLPLVLPRSGLWMQG